MGSSQPNNATHQLSQFFKSSIAAYTYVIEDKISSSSVLSNLDETKSVDLPPVIELPPEEPE